MSIDINENACFLITITIDKIAQLFILGQFCRYRSEADHVKISLSIYVLEIKIQQEGM